MSTTAINYEGTVGVGIVGTANIARKNIRAIGLSKFAKCVAVGSRSLQRAKKYCEELGLEEKTAYGSYEEILRNSDVHAVYIPLPTTLHEEMVAKCVEHNKHVLCEKPCALAAETLLKMLQKCYASGIIFIDGVMFMHNTRLYKIRNKVDKELVLGKTKVREVSSAFCFRGDESFFKSNIRVNKGGDPLGCLGDLGWYNIRFSLFAYDFEMPETVKGEIVSENEDGVPLHFQGSMVWKDDKFSAANSTVAKRTATFFCSFLHNEQQWAKLSGENAMIELEDFVIPFNENNHSFRVNKHVWGQQATKVSPKTETTYTSGIQEVNMWNYFAQSVLQKDGGKQSTLFLMQVALKTQIIIDCMLKSARSGGISVNVNDISDQLSFARRPDWMR